MIALLLISSALLALLQLRGVPLPLPAVSTTLRSPYETEPLLNDYHRLFEAEVRGDRSVLQRYAERGSNNFLRYRTLLSLARDPQLAASKRLDYLERVMAFGLISPLSRDDVRRAQLELAELAKQAGQRERALTAYQRALPLEAAVIGLARLEPEPRALARLFLDAREPLHALSALGGVEAPAVRAFAHAALGEYEAALAAYERWLARSPGSLAAREGKLQALITLGRYTAARQLLTTLLLRNSGQGDRWLEAAAALAEAEGDGNAAAAYIQLGSDAGLWQASRLLELRGDFERALPLYLELSQGTSDYQDDAAYRAYVLATRLGDAEVAAAAVEQVPTFSFFSLLLDNTLLPPTAPLPHVQPTALQRARALERVGNPEAALGELLVALQGAPDEATTVTLAEALQRRGEYAASSEAAARWTGGSRAQRTWRAAYPRAYRQNVETEAAAWEVEPALIWAVMRQESRFYPRAVSTSAARGVMQIVPDTWSWLAELLGEPATSPFVVGINIRYGTFYLSRLLATFGGDLSISAAAYNGGPGYVGSIFENPWVAEIDDFYRFITRNETREYLQHVMVNYEVYKMLYKND